MPDQFVLIEGPFYDRWVARRIIRETPKTRTLEHPRTLDTMRVNKTTRIIRGYTDVESAVSAASRLTQKLQGARKHYEQRKAAILKEYSK
jgi:hypothetical protein